MSFDEIIDLTVYFSVFYIPVYFVCIEVGEITELKSLVNCFIFFSSRQYRKLCTLWHAGSLAIRQQQQALLD